MRKKAFSLIELMIVVSILGIMAAIVIPMFRDNIQKTKEAAAKDSLRILRTAIEAYAAKNNGVPPGYFGDDPGESMMYIYVFYQLVRDNDYLNKLPKNPFNNSNVILMIQNNNNFPAAATGEYGWIYQPLNKTTRLDWPGTDSTGTLYYDY